MLSVINGWYNEVPFTLCLTSQSFLVSTVVSCCCFRGEYTSSRALGGPHDAV